MSLNSLAYANERREDRDDVHHRTTARTTAGALPLLIVNMSPNGLMARCEAMVAVDQRLTVTLPDMAPVAATVRWSLGGRIGCEFERPLAARTYLALLPRLSV